MKKILLASAVAFFGVMNAQVKFGVKGGYSLSNLKVKNFGGVSPDAKSTFYVGGVLEGKVSDKVRLQGEVLYSSLGAKIDYKDSYGGYFINMENRTNLGQISLPLSVKFYPNNEGFAILGGFNLGFIVSAKEKNEISHNLPISTANSSYLNYINSQNGEKDVRDEFKTFDFAPFIGLEYNFSNGLFLETRYNLGVINVLDIGADEIGGVIVSEVPKAYNRYWQLGIGYKF